MIVKKTYRALKWAFQVDREFGEVFRILNSDERDGLKASIRDHGVQMPLLVADLVGKKLLYDGYQRIAIVEELRKEGVDVAEPEVKIKKFKNRRDVLLEIFSLQLDRRQLSVEERAIAVIENKSLSDDLLMLAKQNKKGGVAPKDRINVRSRQAIRARCSGEVIRIIKKAKDEAPEIYARLKSPDPSTRLNVWQARGKLKMLDKERLKNNRESELKKRRKLIGEMPAPEKPLNVLNSIIVGDNLKLLKGLPSELVTLTLTSPPYPINKKYDKYEHESYEKWKEDFRRRFVEVFRLSKHGGRCVINFDTCNSYESGKMEVLPVYADVMNMMKEMGWLFCGEWCWYKQKTIGSNQHNNGSAVTAPHVQRNFEYILWFSKGARKLDGPKRDKDISADEFRRFAVGHWYVPSAPRVKDVKSRDHHPCPYPEELCYRLIKFLTYRNADNVVLDPYNGSGTTAFVAKALGRSFIGLDNSPLYCETARKRLATLDGLSAEEMEAKVKRFIVPEDQRTDGYGLTSEGQKRRKPKKKA